jgi:hypothetical protein
VAPSCIKATVSGIRGGPVGHGSLSRLGGPLQLGRIVHRQVSASRWLAIPMGKSVGLLDLTGEETDGCHRIGVAVDVL